MFFVGLQEELTLSGLLLLRLFNVSQVAVAGDAAKLFDFETLRNDAMFLLKERSTSNLLNTSAYSTENKKLVNGYSLSARAKIVEDYELVQTVGKHNKYDLQLFAHGRVNYLLFFSNHDPLPIVSLSIFSQKEVL